MMFSINRVTLLGNISKDPELRVTQGGTSVCTFSMATNKSRKQADGNYVDVATFHNVVAFGKMADWLAKTLNKGQKVLVDGEINHRKYVNKNNVTVYITEIISTNVIPLAARPAGATPVNNGEVPPGTVIEGGDQIVNVEDVPF